MSADGGCVPAEVTKKPRLSACAATVRFRAAFELALTVAVFDTEGAYIIEDGNIVKMMILAPPLISLVLAYYGEFPRWNSRMPHEFTPATTDIVNNNNNADVTSMYLFDGDRLTVGHLPCSGSVEWIKNVHLLDRPLDTYADRFFISMTPQTWSGSWNWTQTFLIGPCDDHSTLSIMWDKSDLNKIQVDSARRLVTINYRRIPVLIRLGFIREDQTVYNSDRDNITYTIRVDCQNPTGSLRWNATYRRDAILHHKKASAVSMKILPDLSTTPESLYHIPLAVTSSGFEAPLTTLD